MLNINLQQLLQHPLYQEGVINSSARLSDVSGHHDVTAKWSVRQEDFRKWQCFRFLCCHLQNVFLPFGKRQGEFHLNEEVLHLIFQLQRYVDFHNCFKISQKTFWTFVANLLPLHFVYGRNLISHANFADISWWEAWDILWLDPRIVLVQQNVYSV